MTTTTSKTKDLIITSIELINDTIMFVVENEYTAKTLLKRNPRAVVQKGSEDDERYAVIYKVTDCNLINAVKRG